jgi:predicted nucleic acid-binding protein
MIVDANVAAKWVLPESGSDRAAALRGASDRLIAPALAVAEIGNAIWKRARADEILLSDALDALATAVATYSELVPIEDLGQRAFTLSVELDHPIYDCFYLALAERERLPLVTADKRLLAAAEALGAIKARAL